MLIMFSELVQTIYNMALPDIISVFKVSSEQAAQTLSVYFISFAIGVVLCGWLRDRIGRRTVMIIGLIFYAFGEALAIVAINFNIFLLDCMARQALGDCRFCPRANHIERQL
ncbi:MFS transporter [Candidatus Williamhamiltonella defendens]|uniref:MFS transporter n=1 Tax=Candidatus Williamhamiltonella defendens TaxID=138072 RepID=UPI0022A6CEDF|nr:MFS transporter [Candidatus Hamiltonella defensa]